MATAVQMIKRSRTDYNGGRRVKGDKTNILLVHYEHYQTELNPRPKIRAKCFVKIFNSNILAPIHLHIVMLTVVLKTLTLRLANIATTVAGSNRACEDYHSDHIVDGDERITILVHCNHYDMEAFSGLNTRAEFSTRKFKSIFLSQEGFHIEIPTMDHDVF